MSAKFKFLKILRNFLIIASLLVAVILLGQSLFDKTFDFPKKITFGITFSPAYAKFLKLDWQKTYLDILDQLQVRHLRLPSIWEEIEAVEGQFDFSSTDFMLQEAGIRGAKVIQVVGNKQPRWPECHSPAWAKVLTIKERQEKILKFIKVTVERYQDHPEIEAWQVENEPFLSFFGDDCDKADEDFLKKEVELVRGLSNKPIIVSDSGELRLWIIPMQVSDIFGTTLYRQVYDKRLGYVDYPIPPYLYNLKSQIVRNIFAKSNEKTIIIELQAEPWIGTPEIASNVEKQTRLFPLSKLQNYVEFAEKTGFDTIYLWGVEWWYFMKQYGHPEYLNYAKGLF